MNNLESKESEELKDVEKNLDNIKRLGPYTLKYFERGSVEEVTSIEELLKSKFKNDLYKRLKGDLSSNSTGLQLTCKQGVVVSMELGEFFPCCGKAVGKRLSAKERFFGESEFAISDHELDILFTNFINIVEQVLKSCKYSSFSIIVSKAEQSLFYKLISKVKTYKITNEFENMRMSGRNLCIEFCRNLWRSE